MLAICLTYRSAIDRAYSRISTGRQTAQTSSGPIEYAESGQGPPLLVVHGAGGGFDQGLVIGESASRSGFRVIAPSRFGYLGTPLPVDASAAAQADAHVRVVGLSSGVQEDLREWLAVCPVSPEGWLFPSETLETSMSKDNMLYRYIRPRLLTIGLGWVDYQVLRRTYSTLMRKAGVDPKVVADSMGHNLDVNLNTYTETSLEGRLAAVQTLESAS